MVRNYGASGKRSPDPFPAKYDRTFGDADTATWNFTSWIPDLVVICLGTNDYSTDPHPDDSMYIGDYHKFITGILANYPSTSVLCVSTSSGAFENNVKKVVKEEVENLNHPRVYFAPFPKSRVYTWPVTGT